MTWSCKALRAVNSTKHNTRKAMLSKRISPLMRVVELRNSGESLFLSKDFPCSQRGNPQKYRDKLNCYASPSRPGHSFATQRIRIDCVSVANHNLIRLLDKPD